MDRRSGLSRLDLLAMRVGLPDRGPTLGYHNRGHEGELRTPPRSGLCVPFLLDISKGKKPRTQMNLAVARGELLFCSVFRGQNSVPNLSFSSVSLLRFLSPRTAI